VIKTGRIWYNTLFSERRDLVDDVANNPALAEYLRTFERGQTVFLEGDRTQDLCVLISGQLEVLKGEKIISAINEGGTVFGEIAFLLGTGRTATVRARNEAKVLCIPKEHVPRFLKDFPDAVWEIPQTLARRLDELSHVVYGMKTFLDKLPDAVVVTDREGKILSCNTAAERLYGRNWDQMDHVPLEALYADPEAFRKCFEEVFSQRSAGERSFPISHPETGVRYVSTSNTVLRDANHNLEGVLFLGRDTTGTRNLQKRQRRLWISLVSVFLLTVTLAAILFWYYPYLRKGSQLMDRRKLALREKIENDRTMLSSLLGKPLGVHDRTRAGLVLADFFGKQAGKESPYKGILLLGSDKIVFAACGSAETTAHSIGSTYAGVVFSPRPGSTHFLLTLFWADEAHPMGVKSVELAFEMKRGGVTVGWLIFRMDMHVLKKDFGIEENDLKNFRFERY
jgi:PAS domain S-box-containing protein